MTVVLQVFRVVAACSSLFMLLSPSPMVYSMHKNRDTGVMSIVPLLAVLVNSNTWMMYGYLDENYVPVFVTFVAGDLIALTYVVVFYRWTKDRAGVHGVMAIAALVIVATSLYVLLGGFGVTGQTRHEAAQVAGIIADVTGMVMYASPLVKIIQVFKYKSAVFIPIHMVCMGSINNVIWITYSIMDSKWIILIPSFLALCIGVFQMILYFFVYHPSTHPLPADYSDGPTTKAHPRTHDAETNLSHLSLTIESPRPGGAEHKDDFVAVDSTRALSSSGLEEGK